jgi:hypothetical protein
VVLGLDAQGKITSSELVVDDAIFGPVILGALKNVQFSPAQIDGKPAPYWIIIEFVFSIGRPASAGEPAMARNRQGFPRQPSVGR